MDLKVQFGFKCQGVPRTNGADGLPSLAHTFLINPIDMMAQPKKL